MCGTPQLDSFKWFQLGISKRRKGTSLLLPTFLSSDVTPSRAGGTHTLESARLFAGGGEESVAKQRDEQLMEFLRIRGGKTNWRDATILESDDRPRRAGSQPASRSRARREIKINRRLMSVKEQASERAKSRAARWCHESLSRLMRFHERGQPVARPHRDTC